MEKTGFERYGLSSNPFRDLTSESIDNVDIFHVEQELDDDLRLIKEELFDKENKAVIAILGGHGVGKTQRLLLVANEAKRNNYFYVYLNMSTETRWTVAAILDAMINSSNLSSLQKAVSAPKWYKDLVKTKKMVKKKYNPQIIAKVIVDALNENTPSCLLLNDLNNLRDTADMNEFVRVLTIIADNIDPGVLIMMSSNLVYFKNFMKRYVNLNQRINQKFAVPALDNNEAGLVLAKRMIEKRLVDNLDPLYPFTEKSVGLLNDEANGNPRDLLKISSIVLSEASEKKAMVVDETLTADLINMIMNKQLNIDYDEVKQKKDLVVKPKKAKKESERMTRASKIPISKLGAAMGCKAPIPSSNPGIKMYSSPKVKSEINSKNVRGENKDISDNPFSNKSKIPNNANSVRVKCPKCGRVFTFEVVENQQKLRCPNLDCDFIGKIKKKT